MNEYLVSIYSRNDRCSLAHLLQTRTRHIQAHLDEALNVVLTDTEMLKDDKLSFAEMLLCTGASPDTLTWDHEPLLSWAVRRNDTDVVELLINFGVAVNAPDQDGRTCLHHCAQQGLAGLTGVLLAAGADPNLQDTHGCTSLLPALLADDWNTLELLLIDADVNIANHDRETALHVVTLYHEHPLAARALAQLIDMGANLEARTYNGDTALIIATSGGDIDFMRTLITAGCDVDAQNSHGNTALHKAASYQRMGLQIYEDLLLAARAARELIQASADVDLPNQSGRTPIQEAVRANNCMVVQELLRANCDPCLAGLQTTELTDFVESAVQCELLESLVFLLADCSSVQAYLLNQVFSTFFLKKLTLDNHSKMVEEKERMERLQQVCVRPHSLLRTCRRSIQMALPKGCRFKKEVDNLPLPQKLRDFISLSTT